MATMKKSQIGLLTVLNLLLVPIWIINVLGGIGSCIWLIVLRDWWEILAGVALMVASGLGVSIALMPSLLLSAPAAMAIEKGRRALGAFFASLGLFYVTSVVATWCLWVMWTFMGLATKSSLVPMLMWSYEVALAPWVWLAQKDQQAGGNEYSILTVLGAEVSYCTAIVISLLGASFRTVGVTFVAVMAATAFLEAFTAFSAALASPSAYADSDDEIGP